MLIVLGDFNDHLLVKDDPDSIHTYVDKLSWYVLRQRHVYIPGREPGQEVESSRGSTNLAT